jgi:hypothetical protein
MPTHIDNNIKPVALVLSVTPDASMINDIKAGYLVDPWCIKLTKLINSLPGLRKQDGLLYLNDHLVIP